MSSGPLRTGRRCGCADSWASISDSGSARRRRGDADSDEDPSEGEVVSDDSDEEQEEVEVDDDDDESEHDESSEEDDDDVDAARFRCAVCLRVVGRFAAGRFGADFFAFGFGPPPRVRVMIALPHSCCDVMPSAERRTQSGSSQQPRQAVVGRSPIAAVEVDDAVDVDRDGVWTWLISRVSVPLTETRPPHFFALSRRGVAAAVVAGTLCRLQWTLMSERCCCCVRSAGAVA